MIDRKLVLVPALAVMATALPGCVAVAIPALAGGAMFGSRVIDREDESEGGAEPTVAAATQTPGPAPATVAAPMAAKPAPAPSAAAVTAVRVAVPPAAAPTPVLPAPPAGAPVAAATAAAAPIALPSAPGIAPLPEPGEPRGFASFVEYGREFAMTPAPDEAPLSAMLSDPVAVDGQRRRCVVGEQPVVLIDLDPKGGLPALPRNPAKQPRLAWDLAQLRAAGVVIAWLTDLPVDETISLRNALEQSGLDPRGEDLVSLRRGDEDRKQLRKDNLAANACIIAIAGDERPDFDERFKYLKSPEAGIGLETVIGKGWFLVEPVFANAGDSGQ